MEENQINHKAYNYVCVWSIQWRILVNFENFKIHIETYLSVLMATMPCRHAHVLHLFGTNQPNTWQKLTNCPIIYQTFKDIKIREIRGGRGRTEVPAFTLHVTDMSAYTLRSGLLQGEKEKKIARNKMQKKQWQNN